MVSDTAIIIQLFLNLKARSKDVNEVYNRSQRVDVFTKKDDVKDQKSKDIKSTVSNAERWSTISGIIQKINQVWR